MKKMLLLLELVIVECNVIYIVVNLIYTNFPRFVYPKGCDLLGKCLFRSMFFWVDHLIFVIYIFVIRGKSEFDKLFYW